MTKFLFFLSFYFITIPALFSLPFRPCVLDTTKPGYDIADNARQFSNPFEWYTNPSYPGVTLPGPQLAAKCGWSVGSNFVWNANANTCLLNGQGYPLSGTPDCANDIYASSKSEFDRIYDKFASAANNKARHINNNDGSIALIANIDYQGLKVEAAMSIGHGVLSGLCGNCFLLKLDNKYVFQLQTDVRAWSLELTGGANVWIANDNYGGTCHIPDVVEVDCDEVLNSL